MRNGSKRAFTAMVALGLSGAAMPAVAATSTVPNLTAATAAAGAPAPVPVPTAPPNPIRVGIGRKLTSTQVSAPGAMQIVAEGAVQTTTTAGQAVTLTLVNGKIAVSGIAKQFTPPVRLVPVGPPPAFPDAPTNHILYKDLYRAEALKYRGEAQVVITGEAKLSVVNVVNMEDYLLGVVPREMPALWHIEALKAQSVAARTFAVQATISPRFAGEGFDVDDTTSSQVYGGLSGEHPHSSEAVAATRGQVIKTISGGDLINAYFHSSSGGHTANNEDVWTSVGVNTPHISWLTGVPDFDNVPGNTKYSWQFTISPDRLNAAFGLGAVSSINPTGRMGAGGRPVFWQVTGTGDSATKTGATVRSLLGLPANPTKIVSRPQVLSETNRSITSAATVAVVGKDGMVTQRTAQGAVVMGGARTPVTVGASSALQARGMARFDDGVDVIGGGYGHGLGMSQWGAYGMANAKPVGKLYKEILTYYYKGTKVE